MACRIERQGDVQASHGRMCPMNFHNRVQANAYSKSEVERTRTHALRESACFHCLVKETIYKL